MLLYTYIEQRLPIGMEGRIAMKVKGIAIITIPLFIKERFDKGGLKQWIDAPDAGGS